MKEDKQAICDALCEALKRTRAGADVAGLIYSDEHEMVTVWYPSGRCEDINVAADSGAAMILDVVRNFL